VSASCCAKPIVPSQLESRQRRVIAYGLKEKKWGNSERLVRSPLGFFGLIRTLAGPLAAPGKPSIVCSSMEKRTPTKPVAFSGEQVTPTWLQNATRNKRFLLCRATSKRFLSIHLYHP
jgi:hypothetical protein